MGLVGRVARSGDGDGSYGETPSEDRGRPRTTELANNRLGCRLSVRVVKPAAYAAGAVVFALALNEVVMQPAAAERLELGTIFILMASAMAIGAVWLPRRARRNQSIRITVTLLSLLAFSIVTLGTVAIANRMFLSEHDLTLLLVVLSFGVVSAIGFGISVGKPLTSDLNRLSEIAGGDLNGRVDINRQDEVGRLGDALDTMASKLEAAKTERTADAESRRNFFAAVGHDLRTPLSSLRAALEAIQDGVVDDTDRYLSSMERDVAALSSLVEDVFLLARLDSGAFEVEIVDLDITDVADEAIEALSPLAEARGVSVSLSAQSHVIAKASPQPLSRVLRNLLDNAIRHAPSGSSVIIEVGSHGAGVMLSVIDEGEGFESHFLPVAFERFTRADSARSRETGGSGLGLAIVGELVGALDGRIWAEPGPGGRVNVELTAV